MIFILQLTFFSIPIPLIYGVSPAAYETFNKFPKLTDDVQGAVHEFKGVLTGVPGMLETGMKELKSTLRSVKYTIGAATLFGLGLLGAASMVTILNERKDVKSRETLEEELFLVKQEFEKIKGPVKPFSNAPIVNTTQSVSAIPPKPFIQPVPFTPSVKSRPKRNIIPFTQRPQ